MLDDDLMLLAAAYLHVPARRLRALVRGEDQALRDWIASGSARRVVHARHLAREAEKRLTALNAVVVTVASAAYPAGLRDLDDAPAFLCVRGTLVRQGLAIVGSRTPPQAALDFAGALASTCGMPVISGLAMGIDTAAHRGALEAGEPTVAYVGTGLGTTYPPENHRLEDAIVAYGGAIATERLPDEPVTKWSLVHRDRLQAAHAQATVLVCSETDGGAMHALRVAKKLGRARFVLEAQGGTPYAGNEQARADGAMPLPLRADEASNVIRATLAKG